MGEVTSILQAIERGDGTVTDELLPLVYNELRRIAAAKLAREAPARRLLSRIGTTYENRRVATPRQVAKGPGRPRPPRRHRLRSLLLRRGALTRATRRVTSGSGRLPPTATFAARPAETGP